MRGLRLVAMLTVGALVASCVRGLVVRVSGPMTAPIFTVSSARPFQGTVCVRSVRVEMVSPQSQTAWAIDAEGTACPTITRVAYGEAPAGFRMSAPAMPLTTGATYRVWANGDGWAGGRAFRFDTPDRAVTVDGD